MGLKNNWNHQEDTFKGNSQFIFLCNPQKSPINVCLIFFFLFFNFFIFFFFQSYTVLCTAKRFVALETLKHNDLDQFWEFKFHFKHFPRNTQFLSFDGPRNYLYLFKYHRQIFPWPEERPLSHLKVTKMWFGLNIKYLSEQFSADFCCREDISCY